MFKSTLGILGVALLGLSACAHEQVSGGYKGSTEESASAKPATKESGTVASVRKRAAFDLGCPAQDIQVAQMEAGTFIHPATYGATCGEKRATYLERMGTIIKQ